MLLSRSYKDAKEQNKLINQSEKLEFELRLYKQEQQFFEATRKRWYIVSITNSYKFYWDIFVILLAIYNAISLPMQIAFISVQNLYDQSTALNWFERMVDIFFAFDITVNFMTAYIDTHDGETFTSPKKIAKNYLCNGFILDFISTIPLVLRPLIDGVTEKDSNLNSTLNSIVLCFRLTKLMRVRKLNTVITNLHQPMQIKSQLKRLYVIFLLVLICHIQGCIIQIVMQKAAIWVPPTDFGLIEVNTFDEENSFAEQYMKMVYHSTLVYSMVDISARSYGELGSISILVIVSAIINAIIYG